MEVIFSEKNERRAEFGSIRLHILSWDGDSNYLVFLWSTVLSDKFCFHFSIDKAVTNLILIFLSHKKSIILILLNPHCYWMKFRVSGPWTFIETFCVSNYSICFSNLHLLIMATTNIVWGTSNRNFSQYRYLRYFDKQVCWICCLYLLPLNSNKNLFWIAMKKLIHNLFWKKNEIMC